MKNIHKTRQAIKQVLSEIEPIAFEFLKKSKKDIFAEKRSKRRLRYLEFAKNALNPVSQKTFELNFKKGEKLSIAIEKKTDRFSFADFKSKT